MSDLEWVYRLHLTAPGTTGKQKFYSIGVIKDPRSQLYIPLWAWGPGAPWPTFTRGQIQAGRPCRTHGAAMVQANAKGSNKMGKGYTALTIPDAEGVGWDAREKVAEAVMAYQSGRVDIPEPEPASAAMPATEMTGADLLRVDDWGADHMARAIALRQVLVERAEKLSKILDRVQSELELLEAKLISSI